MLFGELPWACICVVNVDGNKNVDIYAKVIMLKACVFLMLDALLGVCRYLQVLVSMLLYSICWMEKRENFIRIVTYPSM